MKRLIFLTLFTLCSCGFPAYVQLEGPIEYKRYRSYIDIRLTDFAMKRDQMIEWTDKEFIDKQVAEFFKTVDEDLKSVDKNIQIDFYRHWDHALPYILPILFGLNERGFTNLREMRPAGI